MSETDPFAHLPDEARDCVRVHQKIIEVIAAGFREEAERFRTWPEDLRRPKEAEITRAFRSQIQPILNDIAEIVIQYPKPIVISVEHLNHMILPAP